MSSKITFTFKSNFEGSDIPNSKVIYETDAANASDVVQEFRQFLLAIGYQPDTINRHIEPE